MLFFYIFGKQLKNTLMEELLNFFIRLRDIFQSVSVVMVDITKYACFIIALILIITSVAADARGNNIGFAAGKWAITAGIVGALITAAQLIYGV